MHPLISCVNPTDFPTDYFFAYGIFPQVQHNAVEGRASHPPCDRGRMGQGRHRGIAEVFRLHRVEYKGQAHELRVHRHDRRLPESEAKAGSEVKKQRIIKALAALNELVQTYEHRESTHEFLRLSL